MTGAGEKLVAVAVPVYKPAISSKEKASLLQLFDILGNHPIYLFTFRALDISAYQKLLTGFRYRLVYFDDKYFKNIAGYNKLLLSRRFYKAFEAFNFLLIYQLDAWVFKNELVQWCHSGYDYIGAPWFSSDKPEHGLPHFMGVGNGGLSLRKIKSHLQILNTFSYIQSPAYLLNGFIRNRSFGTLFTFLNSLLFNNNTFHLLGKNQLHEDVFWNHAARKNAWFKVPDMLTASRFSLESNAEKLFNINHQTLPFGCHAWELYDPLFWDKFIETN
ncbi:DUF5672 family protein [Mucilaginibacter angelicae]|uniref:DUF5672 family protein n=1 Tax=Mucilaginibacter angelicae TaxID=869718 RepID=A0ABV6L517_9SPHI